MIDRLLKDKLTTLVLRSPAVVLVGARGTGKTSLAMEVSEIFESIYIDLRNRQDARRFKDLDIFHAEHKEKLIIVDHIERVPGVIPHIKKLIDKENRNGQFLFISSSSRKQLSALEEELKNDVTHLELSGIHSIEYLSEYGEGLNVLWERGCFPESLFASSNRYSASWRNDYIETYLERHIPLMNKRMNTESLGHFWTMLAHDQGTPFNASAYARSLDVTNVTVSRYLDLLSALMLVRKLEPWVRKKGKRIIKAPKAYIRDTGLTHSLLNINDYNELLGHPVRGGSWEGFVIEQILSIVNNDVKAYYYRTSGGAEIDLILDFPSEDRWAIEIRKNSNATPAKGFHICSEDIEATHKFMIYDSDEEKNLDYNTVAVPLYEMVLRLSEHI